MRSISIIKPGIIFGNIITLTGGFFLGSQNPIDFLLLFFTLIGMSLTIAAGCIFNNMIDSDIDRLMERTKYRLLAVGAMTKTKASIYAVIALALGCIVLYIATNPLTLLIAMVGLFFYVVVYSLFLKRRSTLSTVVGGIAGAIPPVVGYCAVTDRFDSGAIIVFLILFFWQLPHFYAIAIYRLSDFSAASIPVLPNKKGVQYTKIAIVVYTAIFTAVSLLPSIFEYTGTAYFVVALGLGVTWFVMGMRGFTVDEPKPWARKMFLFSILLITILSLMMAIK